MISVALAVYNGEKYLTAQLESIKRQTLPPDEVVICDDGSTDGTVDLCRDFIEKNGLAGWRVFENEKNLGYCLNFYGAVEKCQGDIIFFCDQDDVWYEQKTEVMKKTLEENPEITFLASRYRLIDGEGNESEIKAIPHYEEKFDGSLEKIESQELIGHSFIRGCSCCFRSQIKEKIKPIELRSLLGHDWLICMISALSGGAYCLNTPLMGYRCHQSNASFTTDNSLKNRRLEKRISGLYESVEGHKFIADLSDDKKLKDEISAFTRFEQRRIMFLEGKNILLFLRLFFYLREYSRYYGGKGLKVWLGDFVYAFKRVK